MIVLSVQNLQKSFGGNHVLKDVSFVLQDHQRMGLVGVNGCGKSPLLKILAGLEYADGGSFSLNRGLSFGYMEQQFSAQDDKTVYDVLKDVFLPVFAMEEKLRQMEIDMASTQSEICHVFAKIKQSYTRIQ